jgi:hypothetical protein
LFATFRFRFAGLDFSSAWHPGETAQIKALLFEGTGLGRACLA